MEQVCGFMPVSSADKCLRRRYWGRETHLTRLVWYTTIPWSKTLWFINHINIINYTTSVGLLAFGQNKCLFFFYIWDTLMRYDYVCIWSGPLCACELDSYLDVWIQVWSQWLSDSRCPFPLETCARGSSGRNRRWHTPWFCPEYCPDLPDAPCHL